MRTLRAAATGDALAASLGDASTVDRDLGGATLTGSRLRPRPSAPAGNLVYLWVRWWSRVDLFGFPFWRRVCAVVGGRAAVIAANGGAGARASLLI